MGRKKKSWIDKTSAKSYYLVHRSVADDLNDGSDNDGEEGGVKLAPIAPSNNARGERGEGESMASSSSSIWGKNMVNSLGFTNDGYDYDRHLKPMGAGGGVFIGRDGKQQDNNDGGGGANDNEIDDPLMQDMLAADAGGMTAYTTTLPEEAMDEDLRAALFEDADSDGEFEVLDDDFVQQIIVEPDTPDFDFDAHIAKLMARSELVTTQKARGWSDDEGEDEEEGSELEDPQDTKAYRDMLPEEQRFLEEQFDKTLAEYDDEDLGYMDGADEQDVDGLIDPEDPENVLLMQAMEEMRSLSKSKIVMKGSFGKGGAGFDYDEAWGAGPYGAHVKGGDGSLLRVAKGARELPSTVKDATEEAGEVLRSLKLTSEGEKAEATAPKATDVARLVQESFAEDAHGPLPDHKELETSQEYLREQMERERPDWDCETILSTYSTLENHPSVIGAPAGKNKPRRRRPAGGDGSSVASGHSKKMPEPQRIILTSKLGIPRGYGLSSGAAPKSLASIGEKRGEIVEEGEDEDTEDEDESEEEERQWVERVPKGRQKETSDEKRMRKAAVKEDRRLKRANKKALKTAFATESSAIANQASRGQDTDNISVYRYS